jgi:hypothetical protein
MDSAVMSSAPRVPPAWYDASEFLDAEPELVIGLLTAKLGFAILLNQREVWLHELLVLKDSLAGLEGRLFLEFGVPRMDLLKSILSSCKEAGPLIVEFARWLYPS